MEINLLCHNDKIILVISFVHKATTYLDKPVMKFPDKTWLLIDSKVIRGLKKNSYGKNEWHVTSDH